MWKGTDDKENGNSGGSSWLSSDAFLDQLDQESGPAAPPRRLSRRHTECQPRLGSRDKRRFRGSGRGLSPATKSGQNGSDGVTSTSRRSFTALDSNISLFEDATGKEAGFPRRRHSVHNKLGSAAIKMGIICGKRRRHGAPAPTSAPIVPSSDATVPTVAAAKEVAIEETQPKGGPRLDNREAGVREEDAKAEEGGADRAQTGKAPRSPLARRLHPWHR